ncbi:MAG: CapA family protein [Nevskiales bacterium]|nr:CapA family protein [Nevskiales bacterium]
MFEDLPATPLEALEISGGLRFVLRLVSRAADIFGFWDRPLRKAATNFEDMTLLDKLYWAYKCAHPVLHPERGADLAALCGPKPTIALPAGFEKESTISLGAVGDLIPAQGLEHSKDILYERVADLIFDRTISYAAAEAPLTRQKLKKEIISDKESPIECCSREQFDALKGHRGKNFTVIHTASNHMFDMGTEGVQTTLDQFERDGIIDVGTNREPAEYGQGRILERNGIKIGFVSATFGLNGRNPPPDQAYRIHVAKLLPKRGAPDLSLLKQQIEHCRQQGTDVIIASLHWGHEFEFFPRRRQIEIAHTLIEWGADALIAHHPHVIQPVEYYRTQRDPKRMAVIAYSLGSLTWSYTAPHLALSVILNLSFARGRYRGKPATFIETASATPVFRSHEWDGNAAVTRIEKLADHTGPQEDEARAQYLARIRHYAELVLGDPMALAPSRN